MRADLELGGLGPGLTGEHTIYSYVVGRSNVATDEDGEMDDEALKMNSNYKRWIIKKRFSHFHIFDKILLQIIKEEGGDETWLPEVRVLPQRWRAIRSQSPTLLRSAPILSAPSDFLTPPRRPAVSREGAVWKDESIACQRTVQPH